MNKISRLILASLCIICFLTACIHLSAATNEVVTVAGGYVGDGKPATSASLASPWDVVFDAKGNLYVSDQLNCLVRRITVKGEIVAFAGSGICGFGGDGGPALKALLADPAGLAFDNDGNLLIADSGNQRIRKVVDGKISTIAGNGARSYSGDGGPATNASLYNPLGVSVDSLGNIYIGDNINQVIRMIDPAGIIHTVAGNSKSGFSGDGGPATAAELNSPEGAIADGNGNLYITDSENDRVRKVDSSGTISTYAGNGTFGTSGSGGPATSASIAAPQGLAIANGKLYISADNDIWAVDTTTQVITLIAGSPQGIAGFNDDGNNALSTFFAQMGGITIDSLGNLFVADQSNGRVRKINTAQIVSTVAGGDIGDGGPATASSLDLGFWDHASFDPPGNLYIADYYNHRVRRVSTTGIITTVAGNGMSGTPPVEGVQATGTTITPTAVAVDPSGDIFIVDDETGGIRKVNTTGIITTFSNVFTGFSGALVADTMGNIYASDGSAVVWKITATGTATIVAGSPSLYGYNGDGIPATSASLSSPNGLALDTAGNLYISDSGNNRIRKVNTSGIISTVAGNGFCGSSGDGGPATAAEICQQADVALDHKGNIYIADRLNDRLRMVNSLGTMQTLAGSGNFFYNGNRLPALGTNMYPSGVAVSPTGVVYVVDEISDRVRKIIK